MAPVRKKPAQAELARGIRKRPSQTGPAYGLRKRPARFRSPRRVPAAADGSLVDRRADAAAAIKVFTEDLDAGAHCRMATDDARVAAYERAIGRAVKGRTVLDLGTGPSAILALMCARAGASRVVAVEGVPAAASLAMKAIAEAGFSDKIEVIVGHSSVVELPKVDVAVHEIVGNIATEEGLAAALADLQARPEVVDSNVAGWSLPRRVETLAAPANLNVALPEGGGSRASRPARAVRLPFVVPPVALLGEPKPVEVVDAEAPVALQQVCTVRWQVREPNRLSSFVCEPRLTLDEHEVLDAWTTRTHWSQILVRLRAPQSLEPGDVVELTVRADLRRFPVVHVFEPALLRASTVKTLGRIEVRLR